MTRADRLLLCALVLLAVVSVPIAAIAAGAGNVAVLRGPSGTTRVDLAHDGIYAIDGRMSEVVFEVRGGSIRCVSSDCPDQICVRAGTVRAGAPVVCAPNGVIAELSGDVGVGGLDAVSH